MVRIADEIVDGAAAEGGTADVAATLAAYEQQVRSAPAQRFHTDPVLHAYAITARRCGFADELIADFFASMRQDLEQHTHSVDSLDEYIYGSAEVIGLLCLAAFYADEREQLPATDYAELEAGARALGAAFQKVNFLRDFAEDKAQLGRSYFPGTEASMSPAKKAQIVAEIREDFARAWEVIPRLPKSARLGVAAVTNLYAELTDLIDHASVSELSSERIRVSPGRKAKIIAQTLTHLQGAR